MKRPKEGDALTIKAIHPDDDYHRFRGTSLIGATAEFLCHEYGPKAYEHEGEMYWRCYVDVVDDIKRTFKVGVAFEEYSTKEEEEIKESVKPEIIKRYTSIEFHTAIGELDL